jgi:hypothetical protein
MNCPHCASAVVRSTQQPGGRLVWFVCGKCSRVWYRAATALSASAQRAIG